MEKYYLKDDLKVFGLEVKIFPLGIKAVFDSLMSMHDNGFNRSYYGISYINDDGKIIYKAAAEEKYNGEAVNIIASHILLKRVNT